MVDSGASCNFMSFILMKNLGLKFNNNSIFQVRLADGQVLKTLGTCEMNVCFGKLRYVGTFHVLPGAIPLILGMQWLGEMRPNIDWSAR